MTDIIERCDNNRFAEQFAARLREEAEPVARAAKVEPIRKTRRATKAEAAPAPADPVAQPLAEAGAAEIIQIERVKPPGKVEIITCEQNSVEWHRARMGIPTASNFEAIMTPGKTKAEQKTRRTYMLKLAGEILTGQPMDMVMTRDMERGHLLEPEARDLYQLQTGVQLDRVGFIKAPRAGCSPDSLIGADGGLEIKTKLPHLVLDLILKDEFPEEHKAQVQGAMWLTDREWWDLSVVAAIDIDGRPALAPNIPAFIKRATRDEAFIAQLASEIDRFNTDLDAIVAEMRRRMEADGPELVAA